MNKSINNISILAVPYILILIIYISAIVAGNPIPVYPDSEQVIQGSSDISSLSIAWISGIFIIDFFIDILIIYAGIYLLHRSNLLHIQEIYDFSKTTVLLSILIITIVGLATELFFGGWIGGLLIVLIVIFLSFTLVSKNLLLFSLGNSVRMGMFALVINIVSWLFIYSLI